MLTTIPADGDGSGKAVIIVEWVVFLISCISLGVRYWARHQRKQSWRFDDWGSLVAWFFTIGIAIDHTISVALGGLGQQPSLVDAQSLVLLVKMYPAAEIFWSFANSAIKLSFLSFFMQVFSLEKYRRRIYFAGSLVIALGIGNFIQCLAICRPFAYQWDKSIPGGVCGNQDLGILLVAVFSFVVDVVIFSIPVPPLWSLKMSAKKKRSLTFLFTLGFFVTFVTIVRIVFTIVLITTGNKTYWVSIAEMMFFLEISLSIIAACIPIWQPMLHSRQNTQDTFAGESGQRSGQRSGLKSTSFDSPRYTMDSHRFVRLDDISERAAKRAKEEGDDWTSGTSDVTHTNENVSRSDLQRADAITVTTEWDVSTRRARTNEHPGPVFDPDVNKSSSNFV